MKVKLPKKNIKKATLGVGDVPQYLEQGGKFGAYGTNDTGYYTHGGENLWEINQGFGYPELHEFPNYVDEADSGIHIKKSKRGSLHTALGIPQGEKIPASKLKIKPGDSPALRKKKTFAANARHWKKGEDGLDVTENSLSQGQILNLDTRNSMFNGVNPLLSPNLQLSQQGYSETTDPLLQNLQGVNQPSNDLNSQLLGYKQDKNNPTYNQISIEAQGRLDNRNDTVGKQDASQQNRRDLAQWALWQTPYYAGETIMGGFNKAENKNKLKELQDQHLADNDPRIKTLKRNIAGDNLRIAGGAIGGAFQDAQNILGGISSALHNSKVTQYEMGNLANQMQNQAVINPYRGDNSELGGGTRAAYSKFGSRIKRYELGGKNGPYASNGMELPETAHDLITRNPNVIIEGNGINKAGVGESVGDTNTGTVTNSKGAGTHEEQDSGKAREMALNLGKNSTVLPAGLGITLKQANKLFSHIPSITQPLNDKFGDTPNKTISWGEIGDTQNTKNQVKEIDSLNKQIGKQIKIKKKNEGKADNPNETSIGQKTGELNNKFANYNINDLNQTKQDIEEQMALQTVIHNEVIYPTFEHMKKNLKVYGDKVANSEEKAKFGKKIKLPRMPEGGETNSNIVQPPRTDNTDPNATYSSYPNYENAYRSQHEFLGETPNIIPGMFNTKQGAIEAQGYGALNFPELTSHFYTNNPDVRGTNKMWDLGKADLLKKYPGINPTDEAIGTHISQNLPLILQGHMDALGPGNQGYRDFNTEKLELESPEALQEFISKAGTPINTSRGTFYVDPSDKFTYVNPSVSKNYKPKVEQSSQEVAEEQSAMPINTNPQQVPENRRMYIPEGLHPMNIAGELYDLTQAKKAVPYIEDRGAANALATTSRQRFTDIQPQLNRLKRGTFAQRRFVGTDPISQAQQAQAYSNEYEAANQLYGQKYNADAQIQQNYQQMENALRDRAGTNKANALDQLAERTAHRDEGYYETKRNALSAIGQKYMQNRLENNNAALLTDMFPDMNWNRFRGTVSPEQMAFINNVQKDRYDRIYGNKNESTITTERDANGNIISTKETSKNKGKYGTKLPKKPLKKNLYK